MRILLTGGTGFVGSHMIDYILSLPRFRSEQERVEIVAIRRWRSRDENIAHLYGDMRVKFIEADLMDRGSLDAAVEIAKPDLVFHFAAQSFPESSFLTPVQTLTTNVIGTTNLLEAIKAARGRGECDPVIVSVSSSEVYGMPLPHEVPIVESNPLRAANPYSISKVAHDLMSQYFAKAYGMKIVITRMFSHEGARRGKRFALSSFAHQIVSLEKGISGQEWNGDKFHILVGNLDSVRTYAHIDDAVRAYWLAAHKCKYGEVYNIGGKETYKVGEALEMLLKHSTLVRNCIELKVDPSRIRPTDITLQIPSYQKFHEATGWEPVKTTDDICIDLLNYWRSVL